MGTPRDAARVRARRSGSSSRCTATAPCRSSPTCTPAYSTRAWAERYSAGDAAAGSRAAPPRARRRRCSPSTAGSASRSRRRASTAPATAATSAVWGGELLLVVPRQPPVRPGRRTWPRCHSPAVTAAVGNPCADGARATCTRPGSRGTPTCRRVAAVPATRNARLAGVAARHGLGCVPTTSMGRLFDAVAVAARGPAPDQLRGAGRHRARGRCARTAPAPAAALAIDVEKRTQIRLPVLVPDLVAGLRAGTPPGGARRRASTSALAAAHRTAWPTGRHRERRVPRLVGLTGGVFQNVLLLRAGAERLQERGFDGAHPPPGAAERRWPLARPGRGVRRMRARERRTAGRRQ